MLHLASLPQVDGDDDICGGMSITHVLCKFTAHAAVVAAAIGAFSAGRRKSSYSARVKPGREREGKRSA